VEAVDGGILVEDRAGALWNITPDELQDRQQTGAAFTPLTADELVTQLQAELGEEFQFVRTEHYVIATSGSRVYADWCGTLLERLQQVFLRYWQAAGIDVAPPPAPLPVIIHVSRKVYAESAEQEGGTLLIDAHGYYSMRTNRVVLVDALAEKGASVRTPRDLLRLVAADLTPVSTIIHEGTHQAAFNCGLHRRYADNPVWLTEGMALYFEVPDVRSPIGWRSVGRVNPPRLKQFREALREGRPDDSLTSLIADDERFRDAGEVETAYAEAWAFTHFLIKTRRDQYVSFLQSGRENGRLKWKSRQERLDAFEQAFGVAPAELDAEFLRYVGRMRAR
jgi:hypothetical protein